MTTKEKIHQPDSTILTCKFTSDVTRCFFFFWMDRLMDRPSKRRKASAGPALTTTKLETATSVLPVSVDTEVEVIDSSKPAAPAVSGSGVRTQLQRRRERARKRAADRAAVTNQPPPTDAAVQLTSAAAGGQRSSGSAAEAVDVQATANETPASDSLAASAAAAHAPTPLIVIDLIAADIAAAESNGAELPIPEAGVDGFYCVICDERIWSQSIRAHCTSTLHNFNRAQQQKQSGGGGGGGADPQLLMHASNPGYRLMTKMGWDQASGLGKDGRGRKYPVPTQLRRDRAGLGERPQKSKPNSKSNADNSASAASAASAAAASGADANSKQSAPERVSEYRITHFPSHAGSGALSSQSLAAVEQRTDRVSTHAIGAKPINSGPTRSQRLAQLAAEKAAAAAIRNQLFDLHRPPSASD